jgi:peptide/nickel transport system substrate-binding protein/oligopeptide transport system substrate-binding protein
LDPIHSKYYWESEIVLQIFDGLLRFDQNLNLAPAMAEDWQVSSDGRVYTFRLRKGVRFHNGREVTARDFVYSIARHLDPKSKSEDAEHYTKILGASQYRQGKTASIPGLASLDPYTLKITLERSYAPFLRVLAQQSAAVVPQEEVERPSADFGTRPIGTGPFRFESWDSPGGIFLSMNKDYFEGRPYLDGIRIQTLSDLNPQGTIEDFRNGKLDISFVPADQFQIAQSNRNWVFLNYPAFRIVYLGVNLRNSVMREEHVREAIHFSINKAEIVGHDPDFAIVNNLIPLSLLGSTPRGGQDVYDVLAAQQALRRSRIFQGQPLKLKLWHATPTEERRRLLARLAGCLRAVGIEAEVKIAASVKQMLRKIHSGEAQLFLYGEVIDFPDPDALVNRLFNSRSEGNLFAYSNPKVDQLLLQGQTSTSDELRAQIYSQIEKQVMQDHVIIPLFSARYSFVVQKSTHGIELNSLGLQYMPLRKVWLAKAP